MSKPSDPDDVARAKRYERLRAALINVSAPYKPIEHEWLILQHALCAWQAQVAIDKEERRREREARDA